MNKYVFNSLNLSCVSGITESLKKVYQTNKPVIVCIGSDLAIGDSLGPLIGSILQSKLKGSAYVYGTLNSPVTAKESETVAKTIKYLHPNSKILAIDAGVGRGSDVGLIKISDVGIKPGLGVNKTLPIIGDASIIAIVAEKTDALENILNKTRLSLIYKMSNLIVSGIENYLLKQSI